MPKRREIFMGMAALLASRALPALAQQPSYPLRPIRFVVPLAPGGSADLVARLVAEHLSQRWSQTVLVDMKPGGGTVIGTNVVAHAPADGYTVLFSANSLVINAKLRSNLPYDGLRAFRPVAAMVHSPQVLAVKADSPYPSFKEWLAAVKANPGSQSLASLGPATTQHMAAIMLQQATAAELVYVPFAGGSQAVTAVLGGHVGCVLANLAEVKTQIESGHLRALAVTASERLALLPQVPTVAELGHPGFEAIAWFGMSAPSGTPDAVVTVLAEGVRSALADPVLRQQLLSHGLQPAYSGPAEFGAAIAQSFEHYAHAIDVAGLKIES